MDCDSPREEPRSCPLGRPLEPAESDGLSSGRPRCATLKKPGAEQFVITNLSGLPVNRKHRLLCQVFGKACFVSSSAKEGSQQRREYSEQIGKRVLVGPIQKPFRHVALLQIRHRFFSFRIHLISTPRIPVVLGNWLTADLAPIRAEADPRLRWSSLLIAEPEGTRWPCGVGDRGLTEQRRPLLI